VKGSPKRAGRDIRVSIPTKIFLGFSLVLILFASVFGYNFTRLGQLYEDVTAINRGLVPMRLTLSEIEGELRSYSLLLVERDPVVLRSAVSASRVLFPFPRRIEGYLDRCLDAVDQLAAQDLAIRHGGRFERLRRFVESLKVSNAGLVEASDELQRALEAEGFDGLDEARYRLSEQLRQMQASVRSLSRLTDSVVAEALDWAGRQQEQNVLVVAVTTAAAMGVALLVMLWSARTLRPLTKLMEGVKSLRAGAYETVEVQARNEIGALADEFNQMVRALEERDRRLREGSEALARAYESAIEAERLAAIGRLTSQITHEIRNPLSSIGLNIDLLEEEIQASDGDHTESTQLLEAINREIDRLTTIADEYLQFARLPQPVRKPRDVNQLITDLLSFHRQELHQRDVELELDLADSIEPIDVDASHLRQAVLNLVQNGAESMPDGGRLTVRTRAIDGGVEITVSDEGDGIAADVLDRIFDPFFTTKAEGTGLGLSVTRHIVHEHDGSIRCEPNSGGGTVFVVRLPSRSGSEKFENDAMDPLKEPPK